MISMIKNREATLKFIIAAFALLFLILMGYAFLNGSYHLADEDEAIYYNGARSFSETGSVRATECNTENVSKIWQCNWYGPMYTMFYGSIAKIAGVHNYNFLIANILILAIIMVLIMRANFEHETKLLIVCSFLALYAFVGYAFTFYPETLELLFAVILALKLKVISAETKNNQKQTALYVLLVLFFALFRISTIFWVFGLLAFSKSVKDFFIKLGIGIICFLFVYIYIRYFNAPFYGSTMALVMNDKLGLDTITLLLKKIVSNFYFFVTQNPIYELLMLPVLAITAYSWFMSKNRLMLAACIISLIYFVALFSLYAPFSFFLNKQWACLYPLILIALYNTDKVNLKYIMLLLLLVMSPIAYIKAAGLIRERKRTAMESEKTQPMVSQFEQIRNKVEGGKPITILTLYREFDDKIPFPVFSSSLSVSTTDQYPILYTYNFPANRKHDSTFINEKNFRLYHKIYVDYILSRYPLKIDSTSLTYSTDLFYLYKNNKKTK
jgi:hypothetical protein